jgi:SAM-dependent methyltransferase
MPLVNYHKTCRLCGHDDLETVLYLGEHYLHGLFVFPDFNPPTRRIPTTLLKCKNYSGGCGLVQLRHSIDSDILYSRYGYRSSTNATMRTHLTSIAQKADSLWKASGAKGSPRCLDIGCNDGFLSSQFPEYYAKTGIDPCDIGRKIEGISNFGFINDSFPSEKLSGKFDVVSMIACFYDVNDPSYVASRLGHILSDDGMLVLEVSYWPLKMEKTALDEICHEHVCFYDFQTLERVFGMADLKIFNAELNDINGGSIQLWMCQKNTTKYDTKSGSQNILNIKFSEFNSSLDTMAPYKDFQLRCEGLRTRITNLFNHIKLNRETVHLYGASTKGNVLLQYLHLDSNDIPYAAERSKEKIGGSTLGTNIKMISEEESRAMKPDYYFVPIWSFREEIIEREKEYLNNGGKLIFPLPTLEIVCK